MLVAEDFLNFLIAYDLAKITYIETTHKHFRNFVFGNTFVYVITRCAAKVLKTPDSYKSESTTVFMSVDEIKTQLKHISL